MKAFLLLAANVSITRKNSKITYGLSGSWWTLLDRWYYRFHVSHSETVGKNVCYILNIRSSKNTGLQTQDMISDKKLSLFHPVLSKLSVFVFRYRLRNSSSPSISRYINKIDFRVYTSIVDRRSAKMFLIRPFFALTNDCLGYWTAGGRCSDSWPDNACSRHLCFIRNFNCSSNTGPGNVAGMTEAAGEHWTYLQAKEYNSSRNRIEYWSKTNLKKTKTNSTMSKFLSLR